MLHAFPRTFDPAIFVPPPSVLPPLTAAAYLTLRREAAGRSIADVARRIARHAGQIGTAIDLVRQLEMPAARAKHRETLDRLRPAFAFDPDVYHQLATEPATLHPRICRTCGASAWDDDNACNDCRSGADQ